jgi:polyribonucleotide nucleotidyltransferase
LRRGLSQKAKCFLETDVASGNEARKQEEEKEMEAKTFSMELAGRELKIEFGKYAQQANGSAFVRYGDTVVIVNVTMSESIREGVDFFPLTVDFEEKQYAVGKIPGGFIKREGRPTEKATLTCRLMDRPLRPMFPKGMRNDVQVLATVLSVDKDIPPEIPAMIGSSVALAVSDIPWNGPTGSVVVGKVGGEYVVNPGEAQREQSTMHVTVSGTKDAVLMVEADANEVTEEDMLAAIMTAHDEIKKIVAFIEGIQNEIGKKKTEVKLVLTGDDVKHAVRDFAYDKAVWTFETDVRTERQEREAQVGTEVAEFFKEQYEARMGEVNDALYYLNKEIMRRKILDSGIRADGRGLTDVRPIWCEVGVLPRTHGSAVFTRGETQALTITTLGSMSEVQMLDGLGTEDSKRYMHHYNMPPYATGEAGRMKSPGRREIGHGALAERALVPVIPDEDVFPYALRLVSEIMGSNGSSSMASVCGSTLSLMDAGVPIKSPVAGVAMGLIKDTDSDKVAVLTDIQGLEDFLGDMDFKVAGTVKGITAIQMDIKIAGIDRAILEKALSQARLGRLHILQKMLETLSKPREAMSKYAPKIVRFMINPEKIREVIGPGGKMINKIIAETGVKIDIEDDGRVYIATPDADAAAKARKIIEGIAKDVEVGDVYLGKVVRIMNFGAFIELTGGKDGMLHISKMADHRVEKVEDVMNIGDEIEVKVSEIDSQGRVNLIRNDITYSKAPMSDANRPGGSGGQIRRPPRRDGRPHNN